MMHKAIGGAGLLWFAAAWPAAADCVSDCQAATYCDSEMDASGECSEKLNACYQAECSRPRYGALAYDDESGAYGWSNEFQDGAGAERKAMAGCQENGSACKIVYDFWNSCAALAADRKHRYSIGRADTREAAQDQAIATCQQSTGATCDIEVWACSGR
jgi:hypothetical protein